MHIHTFSLNIQLTNEQMNCSIILNYLSCSYGSPGLSFEGGLILKHWLKSPDTDFGSGKLTIQGSWLKMQLLGGVQVMSQISLNFSLYYN